MGRPDPEPVYRIYSGPAALKRDGAAILFDAKYKIISRVVPYHLQGMRYGSGRISCKIVFRRNGKEPHVRPKLTN